MLQVKVYFLCFRLVSRRSANFVRLASLPTGLRRLRLVHHEIAFCDLDYRTPYEVFFNTKTFLTVALTS